MEELFCSGLSRLLVGLDREEKQLFRMFGVVCFSYSPLFLVFSSFIEKSWTYIIAHISGIQHDGLIYTYFEMIATVVPTNIHFFI